MKLLLPIAIVILTTTLACLTWYATLMPFWAVQSGEKGAQVFYSQGMGLWLNYTEHVGDPTFDPGNSLWIPPQSSGVQTYALQCEDQRAFCKDAIGDLHIQYCEVLRGYCGPATTFLQITMALLSGTALVGVVWSVLLVATSQRTIVDHWLMHLCIFNGVSYLAVATVWYFTFFRVVLSTTFYKDQFNRCNENPTNRTCWHIGTCVYLLVACAVLYPALSVIVASYESTKFKTFQRRLRKLLDMTTAVELPREHAPLDTRAENIQSFNASDKKGGSRGGTELSAKDTSQSLQPLQRMPSAVQAIDVHQIEGIQVLSDDEEEKERDDAAKYGASREFIIESPREARRKSLGSPTVAEPKASSPTRRKSIGSPLTERKASSSSPSPKRNERQPLKHVKSIEF